MTVLRLTTRRMVSGTLLTNRGGVWGDFLRWQLGLGRHETSLFSPDEAPPYKPIMAEPNFTLIKDPVSDQVQITWVGHSTFLVQMGRVNILTDPIFNDRSSPFSFGGVKRLAPTGLSFADLFR